MLLSTRGLYTLSAHAILSENDMLSMTMMPTMFEHCKYSKTDSQGTFPEGQLFFKGSTWVGVSGEKIYIILRRPFRNNSVECVTSLRIQK